MSAATVVFSCLGHLYIHLCTAFYFVIVLALEIDWRLPYHELIELWTLGSLMVGVAALPAGLLADRLGAPIMMVIYFLGLGVCSITAGLVSDTSALLLSLTGIGIFAAIYHPVGIPWLVRNAGDKKGKVLGINGIFGSLGGAAAGISSGFLIDTYGWRAAFYVPGIICLLTGLVLIAFVINGRVTDTTGNQTESVSKDGRVLWQVFLILMITMLVAGLIYAATQTALPKVFAIRIKQWVGSGTLGVGLMVALVYTLAGFMQVMGGHFADRYPLKRVYLSAIGIQVPLLFIAAYIDGIPLLLIATLMVVASASALPAENMLLARYVPQKRHGLAFGLKFVLAFGATPLAVQLVAFIQERTGEFLVLFLTLAVLALCSFTAASFLPRQLNTTTD